MRVRYDGIDSAVRGLSIIKQKAMMEMDIVAVTIGYGVQREVAREIAARIVNEVFSGRYLNSCDKKKNAISSQEAMLS